MSLKINKYLEKLDEILEENNNFFYVFRGQPSKEYELNCTAVRLDNPEFTKEWLKENQKMVKFSS